MRCGLVVVCGLVLMGAAFGCSDDTESPPASGAGASVAQGGGGAGGSGGGAAHGGEGGFGGGGAGGAAGPSGELAALETQLFATSCGSGPNSHCHGSAPVAGGLDLRPGHAYASLVNQPSALSLGKIRVVPNDLQASFLWQKMNNDLAEDGSEGEPMPLGEAIQWQKMPDDKLALIQAWIESGANP